MTQPFTQPHLTPQFCFSYGALRGEPGALCNNATYLRLIDLDLDFLRLSRSSIDDSIAQNLNALVTPSRSGFDPSSTSQRAPRPMSRQIDAQACSDFKEKVLFPSWEARTEVLNYCALVAASPDPDDPDRTLRELEKEKDRERIVDERLDPYSGRFFPREARTERLASLIRQERGVEGIVRHRTWEVIQQRCVGDPFDGWEDAVSQWRKTRNSKPLA
ncbi:caffeine-induced death 2 [Fusarium albosuccineum]|uniref:Caffeine-induced death 2 n=1 Tax=Fusarium albosuccineum TaxID=1237068 RepID=A0A8H4LH79_9HYPO|nr:caffeine-induced death 2 [Fusarium albosuccineum]